MTLISRRRFLEGAVGGGLIGPALQGVSRAQKSSLVARENAQAGTTDWQLTNVRSENQRSELIEGYCSKTSVRPGESIDIFVSTTPASSLTIDIFRMGYYQGAGGALKMRLGPFEVGPEPTPPVKEHRVRECQWTRTTRFIVPEDWLSGVYLGKLRCDAHRFESYVVFIVRDDREAKVLFQCSDTTWQAYNEWPGGYSLYDSDDPAQPLSSRTWVGFDRPYAWYRPNFVSNPLSQGSGEFLLWEFPLCHWLEKRGYDVTYWSNLDTHRDPDGLRRANVFLSVGHDEYWTLDMFEHVQGAVRDGVSVAFLSGNCCMWMIETEPAGRSVAEAVDPTTGLTADGERMALEPDPNGPEDRLLYRAGRFGGLTEEERATGMMGPFSSRGPNENTLIGARTVYPFDGAADWVVRRPDHWIFEGTGMELGEGVPGLVGWEFHGDPADIPGLEVLASGTTRRTYGDAREATFTSTIYPGPQENWVFNASTIYWCQGLSSPPGHVLPYTHETRPHGPDPRVKRITENFLRRGGATPESG